ncbi:MAG: hypothetical protein WB610_15450, partial [Rhodomicrobium sp.]
GCGANGADGIFDEVNIQNGFPVLKGVSPSLGNRRAVRLRYGYRTTNSALRSIQIEIAGFATRLFPECVRKNEQPKADLVAWAREALPRHHEVGSCDMMTHKHHFFDNKNPRRLRSHCANIDAVIAALLSKTHWQRCRSGAFSGEALDDPINRGRDMDARASFPMLLYRIRSHEALDAG